MLSVGQNPGCPSVNFLHREPDFGDLLQIVAETLGLSRALVEKDSFIMIAMLYRRDPMFLAICSL